MASLNMVLENIKEYLPKTSLRAVSKQFTDKTYCDLAAHIYNDDMNRIVENKNHVVYYNDAENLTYAILQKEDYQLTIKMIKEDNYYTLSYEKFEDENLVLFDIDMISKYNLMKNRGCEDDLPYFSKNKTLDFLLKTFKDYFNPDIMSDIVYLYIYLYTNLILLNYPTKKLFKKFDITKLPRKAVLQEIYDMYNLLYVHLNLLEL